MSNFIDDVLGTPRKRSKAPAPRLSPLASPSLHPSPLRREQSAEVFHSALAVPTQATFAAEEKSVVEPEPEPVAEGRKKKVGGGVRGKDERPVRGAEVVQPAEIPLPMDGPAGEEGEHAEGEVRTVEEHGEESPTEEEPAKEVPATEEPAPQAEEERSVVVEPEVDASSGLKIVPPIPVAHSHPAILIGISGCTSSGKTMLSHLLSWILPPATPRFVLHQDDFFIPKRLMVPNKDGDLDADCPDAINFGALIRVLEYVKCEGKMPPGFRTEQDEVYERDHASALVSEAVLDEAKEVLERSGCLEEGQPVCTVEGFLLYHEPRIRELLDVKLFLRTTKEVARARRFGKPDYASEHAEEDFWKTKDYFDRAVWPNFVEAHSGLFHDEDVEGSPRRRLCRRLGILVQPQLEMSIDEVLRWASSSIAERRKTISTETSRDLDPEEVLRDRFEVCDCGSGWIGKIRRTLYDIV